MSIHDYPEHLNPFAEHRTRLSLSNSFREFKRTLRKSFRIKKKHEEPEVTVRQKTDTIRRVPVSIPNHSSYQITEALPRSRFRERLGIREATTSRPGSNPFEDEQNEKEVEIRVNKRRREKKKAPLPPKSLSSQDINNDNLDVPRHSSHWSLNSTDSDYSEVIDNISTTDVEAEVKRASMLEQFKDFNNEMKKLNNDENIKDSVSKVPDLVISCPNDTNTDLKDEEPISKKEELDANGNEDENAPYNEIINEVNGNEEKQSVTEISEQVDNVSNTSESDTELVVTDITNNLINVEKKSTEDLKETFHYNEKISLYIAGSRDELNDVDQTYTGKVSLYITDSGEDLDACNNNNDNKECDKNGKIVENEEPIPIPKQRKAKLTRSTLLGT